MGGPLNPENEENPGKCMQTPGRRRRSIAAVATAQRRAAGLPRRFRRPIVHKGATERAFSDKELLVHDSGPLIFKLLDFRK